MGKLGVMVIGIRSGGIHTIAVSGLETERRSKAGKLVV